jgi:SnoaL-like domain
MNNMPTEISNFFLAMQAGSQGGNAMEKVLATDAVYEEPFTGKTAIHHGRDAILSVLRAGWAQPLPDMHIEIDRAETTAEEVVIDWTCYSSGLPGGAGRGTNRFTLKDGKIARLVTTFR